MNKEIRKHIKHVTSSSYLKKRFDKCEVYFEESTHINFDLLGFEDSTWHHDGSPSFRVTSENECRVIQCFMGEDEWDYAYYKRFQLCIDDEHVFDSMELHEMYGFIKSNLDLFKSLANGDEQKRKDDEQKLELEHSITILEEIKERLHSEIFYDSNWVDNESCNNQADFLIGVDIAINKLKKERK
tara:strand:- start:328 stop:882 length:555 start_codon:yes stop_codon:yes gene_type:complete